jgi:hypothetical protein
MARLPDIIEGKLPDGYQAVGSYWKILDADGNPKKVLWHDKLTEDCWRVTVPIGDEDGYAIANLEHHTVRENEDGTISVLPGDGSSNSILVTGSKGRTWHGYVYDGELRAC